MECLHDVFIFVSNNQIRLQIDSLCCLLTGEGFHLFGKHRKGLGNVMLITEVENFIFKNVFYYDIFQKIIMSLSSSDLLINIKN